MQIWQNRRKLGEDAPAIEIPSTGDEWQLFTGQKGCAAAARELAGAMKKCLRTFDDLLAKHGEDYPDLVGESMRPFHEAASKHGDHGACDTEAHDVACGIWRTYASMRGYHISWRQIRFKSGPRNGLRRLSQLHPGDLYHWQFYCYDQEAYIKVKALVTDIDIPSVMVYALCAVETEDGSLVWVDGPDPICRVEIEDNIDADNGHWQLISRGHQVPSDAI